jgi:hypothetical protein
VNHYNLEIYFIAFVTKTSHPSPPRITLPTSYFLRPRNGPIPRKVEKESWRRAKQGRQRQSQLDPRSIEVTVAIFVPRIRTQITIFRRVLLLLELKRRPTTRSFRNYTAPSGYALWRSAFKLQTTSTGTRNSSSNSDITFSSRIL